MTNNELIIKEKNDLVIKLDLLILQVMNAALERFEVLIEQEGVDVIAVVGGIERIFHLLKYGGEYPGWQDDEFDEEEKPDPEMDKMEALLKAAELDGESEEEEA
jgi:hypothetical protein